MKSPSRIGLVHIGARGVRARAARVAPRACSCCRGAVGGERAAPAERRRDDPRAARRHPRRARRAAGAEPRDGAARGRAAGGARPSRAAPGAAQARGVPAEWAARATDATRKWVTLPGRFVALDVASIIAMRGVHADAEPSSGRTRSRRARAASSAAWTTNGAPVDGIELALDTLLRGDAGRRDDDARRARPALRVADRAAARAGAGQHGRRSRSTTSCRRSPSARSANAVAKMGAEGGDIVVLDPTDGEMLAMASRAPGSARDRGDGAHRAVRAGLDAQAVHRRRCCSRRSARARRRRRARTAAR